MADVFHSRQKVYLEAPNQPDVNKLPDRTLAAQRLIATRAQELALMCEIRLVEPQAVRDASKHLISVKIERLKWAPPGRQDFTINQITHPRPSLVRAGDKHCGNALMHKRLSFGATLLDTSGQANSQSLGQALRNGFFCVLVFTAGLLAGCNNVCFVGTSNNGNGTVGISAGNPPPACPLNPAHATVRVVNVKSPACESCTASIQVEHVFVTPRSIQIHTGALADASSPDWVDLAPVSGGNPRQIDLIGGATSEILIENATIPAGDYRQVHLQFVPDSPATAEELSADNVCGQTRSNCLVMANGRVEPLYFPSDKPELFITDQSIEKESLTILPDARIEIRLSLEPRLVFYSSSQQAWKRQIELGGTASAVPQPSSE